MMRAGGAHALLESLDHRGGCGAAHVLGPCAATPEDHADVGLLILFAWCTVWSAVELVRSTTTEHRISNGLHLIMSLVMLAMVPRSTYAALSAVVPLSVQAGFFVVAARVVRRPGGPAATSGPAVRPHLRGPQHPR